MKSRRWRLTDYQVDWMEEYSRQLGMEPDEILRRAVDEFMKRKRTDVIFQVAAGRSQRVADKNLGARPVDRQLEQENWESGEEVVTFGLGGRMVIQEEQLPKKLKRRGRRKLTPFEREERNEKQQHKEVKRLTGETSTDG